MPSPLWKLSPSRKFPDFTTTLAASIISFGISSSILVSTFDMVIITVSASDWVMPAGMVAFSVRGNSSFTSVSRNSGARSHQPNATTGTPTISPAPNQTHLFFSALKIHLPESEDYPSAQFAVLCLNR